MCHEPKMNLLFERIHDEFTIRDHLRDLPYRWRMFGAHSIQIYFIRVTRLGTVGLS